MTILIKINTDSRNGISDNDLDEIAAVISALGIADGLIARVEQFESLARNEILRWQDDGGAVGQDD